MSFFFGDVSGGDYTKASSSSSTAVAEVDYDDDDTYTQSDRRAATLAEAASSSSSSSSAPYHHTSSSSSFVPPSSTSTSSSSAAMTRGDQDAPHYASGVLLPHQPPQAGPSTPRPIINLYPLENYSFFQKDKQMEKDTSVADRMARMERMYHEEGMRRSVEGIVLVHKCGPGGKLKPGVDETEGLRRKIANRLADPNPENHPAWQMGDLVAEWWRPHFEPAFYPYPLPHIKNPKECKRMFLIRLPEKCTFKVAKNWKLVAVPLFELYDNSKQFGPVISSIPQLLSRFEINYL